MSLPGFTHSISTVWSNGQQSLSGKTSLSADKELSLDVSVAADATVNLDVAFTIASLEMLYLLASKDCTITFTLSTGTKAIALVGGIPFRWIQGDTAFSAHDIDSVSITAGSADTDVRIRGLLDATQTTTA